MEIEVDYYELLEAVCKQRWKELSDAAFNEVPEFISNMFSGFLENPLCLTITSILLFAAGVMVFCNIIRSVKSWGV